jgi:hypothetical protein
MMMNKYVICALAAISLITLELRADNGGGSSNTVSQGQGQDQSQGQGQSMTQGQGQSSTNTNSAVSGSHSGALSGSSSGAFSGGSISGGGTSGASSGSSLYVGGSSTTFPAIPQAPDRWHDVEFKQLEAKRYKEMWKLQDYQVQSNIKLQLKAMNEANDHYRTMQDLIREGYPWHQVQQIMRDSHGGPPVDTSRNDAARARLLASGSREVGPGLMTNTDASWYWQK